MNMPPQPPGGYIVVMRSREWVWPVGVMVAAFLIRLTLTLTHDGYLGVDGGAYLLQVKRLLGLELTQIDFTRVPLGPGIILLPFTVALGDDVGYKVWASLFAVVPLFPAFYLLARRFLSPKVALVALAFLSVDLWQWEMLVTGVLPLIGIGLILLALWGLSGTGQPIERVAVIVAVGLIPYVNQTSTGLAAVTLPVFLLSLCVFTRSPDPIRRNLSPLATGVVIALFALPWYKDVLPGSPRLSFPGPKIFMRPWSSGGWVQVWFAVPAALAVVKWAPTPALKALAVAMGSHSILTLFSSYDESIINIFFRSQHVVSPLLILCIAWGASSAEPRLSKAAVRPLTAGVFGLMVVGSAWLFNAQTGYSDMITPEMDRARAFIPDSSEHTIVTNGFMTGLWLAALERSPTTWTFSTEPPPRFAEQYRHTQCLLGWTTCFPSFAAEALNAEYVLVDTRFPHINHREPNLHGAPDDTWAPTHDATWLDLVYSEGTVRLWRVKSG